MPTTPRPAYPVAVWEEPPLPAATLSVGTLTAYLLTDGSVEFFAVSDTIPAGAVVATLRDSGDGTEEVVSGASAGRRVMQNSVGHLFFS